MLNRRQFYAFAFAAGLVPFAYNNAYGKFKPVVKTDDEWKALLTPQQYQILRQQGTERPFTSALLEQHGNGLYLCVGCDLPLFPSRFKYDSKTGWPSFYNVIDGHVDFVNDFSMGYVRKEYHCARCGGHHGHLFNDGPKPTGLRYCSNGAVLKFVAA